MPWKISTQDRLKYLNNLFCTFAEVYLSARIFILINISMREIRRITECIGVPFLQFKELF